MFSLAITILVLALDLGATLLVALCERFSRQGKLLRILLVVAVPVLGACLAVRMVYAAAGVPTAAPSPAQSVTDIVQNSAFEGVVEIAKHVTSSPHEH